MICRIPWVIMYLTQQCDSTNSNYFTWDLTVWCWVPFKPHLHYLYLLLFFNRSLVVFCFFFCCLFCYFVLFYCFVTCFMIQMKYKSWQNFLVVAPTLLRTKHFIWWCNFTFLFFWLTFNVLMSVGCTTTGNSTQNDCRRTRSKFTWVSVGKHLLHVLIH